jgi:alpha-aminoadipate carrier protein LysW
MEIAFCLSCGEEIHLPERVEVGQRLNCPYCRAELEVIGTDPVELDWAYEEYWEEGLVE